VEGALQVGLGLLGLREPLPDVGDPRVGDRVALALRSAARLDAVDHDRAVLQQSRHGRVDLAVVERAVVPELDVEFPLQVVAVARAGLQESEQGVADAHDRGLYTTGIPAMYRACS